MVGISQKILSLLGAPYDEDPENMRDADRGPLLSEAVVRILGSSQQDVQSGVTLALANATARLEQARLVILDGAFLLTEKPVDVPV